VSPLAIHATLTFSTRFLTNQFTLPAVTICVLYKSRQQVELF
jgi:hypothetical protein